CLVDEVITYRDLLSFPTRRSSDLRYAAALACSVLGDWEHARVHADFARTQDGFPHDVGDALATLAAEDVIGYIEVLVARLEGLQDRKSTRLNSSHVAISYAVFCLN